MVIIASPMLLYLRPEVSDYPDHLWVLPSDPRSHHEHVAAETEDFLVLYSPHTDSPHNKLQSARNATGGGPSVNGPAGGGNVLAYPDDQGLRSGSEVEEEEQEERQEGEGEGEGGWNAAVGKVHEPFEGSFAVQQMRLAADLSSLLHPPPPPVSPAFVSSGSTSRINHILRVLPRVRTNKGEVIQG